MARLQLRFEFIVYWALMGYIELLDYISNFYKVIHAYKI